MSVKLTAERLREVLSYDSDTGVFAWRQYRNAGAYKGQVAGSTNGRYLQIRIDGVKYATHRLAWLYMLGEWPASELDHRNTVKTDNRWLNLRLSDRSTNLQNQRRAPRNSHTGLLGVSRRGNGYAARINVKGDKRYLGYFQTAEAAHAAYVQAKRQFHEGNTL